ncbi:MAG: DUF881 domain-containing protein [Micrococcales bacterium]|nr:DUF881 domain-containing protein [Micrococcales bacterium]
MSEPEAGPMSTRRTTGAARRARVRWRLLVPVITAAAGLMFAMSFRAAGGSDLRADRDLPGLILERNQAVASKVARLDVLQKEVESLSRTSAPTDARLQVLSRTADKWSEPAEIEPVSGPSITVSLNDSAIPLDSLPAGATADDIVVHQQDVQAVVNALWAGGAEAMMLQDQRVISTSAVRCVGNTLILQGRVYSPPYVISAIGDVRAMQARLDADPVVTIYREYVDALGLGYEVSTSDHADFPAYSGSVDLRYATAIEGGPDESKETK